LQSCVSVPHDIAHFECEPIAVTAERQHTSPCAQSAVSSHSSSAELIFIAHVPGSMHEYITIAPLIVRQQEKPLIDGHDVFSQSISPGVELKLPPGGGASLFASFVDASVPVFASVAASNKSVVLVPLHATRRRSESVRMPRA
jgi:hypothetical protein